MDEIIADNYDSFIFDLDGTVYRGSELIYGADTVLNQLILSGKKIVFMSNKTTGNIEDYSEILKNFGINVKPNQFVNATIVVVNYLASKMYKKFYAIAEEKFINKIESLGLKYSENSGDIDLVLVTLDRNINDDKIRIAENALKNGAHFLAANIDRTCPVESNSEIIDAGITIEKLENLTGKKLENHFGKPSKFMFEELQKKLDGQNDKCLLIGDRLETDILMGNKYGIDTAWVKTGVRYSNEEIVAFKPTYILDSILNLIQ